MDGPGKSKGTEGDDDTTAEGTGGGTEAGITACGGTFDSIALHAFVIRSDIHLMCDSGMLGLARSTSSRRHRVA